MRKTMVFLMLLSVFLPAQAKSQDALTTFIFLFVDSTIDVAHDYGSEFVRENAFSGDGTTSGRKTIRVVENCIFEQRVEGKDMHGEGAPANLRVVDVMRWNFNKAFFDETEAQVSLNGDQQFIIHGDNGLIYHGLFCLSDARTCQFGSAYRGESQGNQFAQESTKPNDRTTKAMKYFVQTFCPGAKRQTKF
jgi:hypothetical protein